MNELDIFRLLLARRDNYGITDIQPVSGRAYSIVMRGKMYNTVILPTAFDFYQMRYHLCEKVPTLVICFIHDTVLPIACLSLKGGHIADPHDLPAQIKNVEAQRHRSKVGSQVLLGMYLCGMKDACKMIEKFEPTTRKRYLARARELGKRRPGRPVDTQPAKNKVS
jgi:hypothetical protein